MPKERDLTLNRREKRRPTGVFFTRTPAAPPAREPCQDLVRKKKWQNSKCLTRECSTQKPDRPFESTQRDQPGEWMKKHQRQACKSLRCRRNVRSRVNRRVHGVPRPVCHRVGIPIHIRQQRHKELGYPADRCSHRPVNRGKQWVRFSPAPGKQRKNRPEKDRLHEFLSSQLTSTIPPGSPSSAAAPESTRPAGYQYPQST